MALLTLLAAALLLGSGFLKIRSGRKAGVGWSPLAAAEALAGAALVALSVGRALGTGVPPRWAVPGAILLVLVSTIEHGMKLRAERLHRADTEGGRLVAYVKYLSGRKDSP